MMTWYNVREREGFTLLEILLSTSLMGIVLSLAIGFIFTTTQFFQLEEGIGTTSQSGELAMEMMTIYLRMASEVQIREDHQEISFKAYYRGAITQLSFLPTADNLSLGFRSGVNINPLIDNLEEIYFQWIGNAIMIRLTIHDEQGQEYTFTSSVIPRSGG